MTDVYLAKNTYPAVEQLRFQLPPHRLNPLPIPIPKPNFSPSPPITPTNNMMILHRITIYLPAKNNLSIRL